MTEEQEMEGSRQGDGRRAWMETAETETEMAMEIGFQPWGARQCSPRI